MEFKFSKDGLITDSKLAPEDRKIIQKFINHFASKLKVDFDMKDTKITVDIKQKEDGTFVFIKFKDSEVKDVDVSQLNIFEESKPPLPLLKTGGEQKQEAMELVEEEL